MTIFLLLLTALLLAIIVSALIPVRFMLALAGGLSCLQVYTLPLGSVYFSASHLGSLGVWRALRSAPVRLPTWYSIVIALTLWQGISVFWSPSPYLAIRQIFYWVPFLFLLPAVISECIRSNNYVEKLLSVLLLSTLIQVALVIGFRVAPSIEAAFLSSPFARLFISPNVLGEIRNGAYTIFDAAKSGGFFVNANVAATYMGMCAFIAWGFGKTIGKSWPYWVAMANLFGVFLTGSKAGAALAVVLPLIAYGIHVFRAGRISIKLVATFCFAIVIVTPIAIWGAGNFLESRFVEASSGTLSERFAIWDFAWQLFKDKPFFGLGFGGWETEWPRYALGRGLNPLFPPHNSLIALFVQSGSIAVVLAISFCLSFLLYLWRIAIMRNSASHLAFGLFFAASWAFIQSLGENFGILGETHITPLLALATGYVLYLNGLTNKS